MDVGVEVAVRARQVDLDDVVGRAGGQTVAQLVVDHVVGRRDDGRQAADAVERVVEGVERLDVGHGAAEANNVPPPPRRSGQALLYRRKPKSVV